MKFSFLINALNQLFIHQLPKTSLTQLGFWAIASKIGMMHLIDVAWCFQHFFTGLGVVTRNFTDFTPLTWLKNQIYLGVLGLWFLRLGGYLMATRIFKEYKEPRYEDLAKGSKYKRLYFFAQYQGQGILALITSFPLYYLFTQNSKEFSANNIIGIGLALIGIIGEAIADQQLYNFKKVNNSHDKVFRGGFFKKARHPNLFFELLTWTGFAIAALDLNNLAGTAWALVGPITLWSVMNFVTIPATTRQMKKSKPNYDKVIRETNKFIPI